MSMSNRTSPAEPLDGRPSGARELTLRAVIVALLVAAVIGASWIAAFPDRVVRCET